MDAGRWRETEDLFERALERPEAERGAFVRAATADRELVEEVLSLLAHHRPGAEETAGPARIVQRAASSALDGLAAPGARELGSYRLIRRLGEGGMGAVWLAARADDEYRHEVAIKVLSGALRSAADVERLRAERQILARLDHPAIARLLDGGTAPDGTPYLVMERVDGAPLDVHCAERGLGLEARLRLFLEVCDGVASAHRQLVVHRDLKPSNILVTRDGHPKLLDFGIAKLLEGSAAGHTALHERRFTLEYASPEQVRGDATSTATDVYSLGVVLYELLTGGRPHALDGLSTAEVERRVSTSVPETASARVRRASTVPAASWIRELRGDLDNILLRALAADPSRRYSSVEAFADDLRRHLARQPVRARPDTWGYRASRFVARHRWAVAGAVIGLVALVGFTVALAVEGGRTARALDRALAAEREAGEVSSFLRGVFEINDPSESRGNLVTARELLDRGTERIERELAGAPPVQAALLSTIGHAYTDLGLEARGVELLRRSVEVRESIARESPGEATDLALALALQHHGNGLRELSRYAEAEPPMRRGLEIRRRWRAEDAEEIADSLNDLGVLEVETGRLDDAEADLQRALTIRRRVAGAEVPITAVTLSNLVLVANARGDFERGLREVGEVLAIRRRALGENHPQTLRSLQTWALALVRLGRLEEGVAGLRDVVGRMERVLGADHPHRLNGLNSLASALQDLGDLEAAEPIYRRVLEGRQRLYPTANVDTAVSFNNLASLLEDRGRFAEAAQLHARSYAMRRELLGASNVSVARAEHNWGRALWAAGDRDAGLRHMNEALAWRRGGLPADHPDTSASLVQIGRAERERGRLAAARASLDEGLAMQRRLWPKGHFRIVETLAEATLLEVAARDASACLRRVEEGGVMLAAIPAAPVSAARLQIAKGHCLALAGRLEPAQAALTAGAAALAPQFGPDNPWVRLARSLD